MKNFEKYFDDLTVSDFGLSDGKVVSCIDLRCDKCDFCTAESCSTARMVWLKAEYEDTSKINIPPGTPIDTKVLVSEDGLDWFLRYYAGRYRGVHMAWNDGRTSWTANLGDGRPWKYMKLYNEEDK